MKTIPAAAQTRLDSSVNRLVLAMRITRRDGLVIAFTGYDKSHTYDSTTFIPDRSFMEPSTRNETVDDKIGEFRFHAILDSVVKRTEFLSHVYDYAAVECFLLDPLEANDANQIPAIQTGTLGEINNAGERAQIEFRGLKQPLNQQTIRTISPTCENTFGLDESTDTTVSLPKSFCSFDVSTVTYDGTVDTVTSQKEIIATLDLTGKVDPSSFASYTDVWFEFGLLTWATGNNVFNSVGRSVSTQYGNLSGGQWTLRLIESMAGTIQVGDTFTIQAGCDLNFFGKCGNVYYKTQDFNGFPYANKENLLSR